MVRVDDVAGAVKATLLILVAAATPKTGVTRVGEVANTTLPDPVGPARVILSLTVRVLPSAMVNVDPEAGVVRVTLLTVVGVMAPKVRVIAGVVVGLATDPDTPLAVTTDKVVTVPVPPTDTNSNPSSVDLTEATLPD